MVLLTCLPANPQSNSEGSVEGRVRDVSGAAIVGARVTARRLNTPAKFTTITDQEGFFHFPLLPVGHYELLVERAGFASFRRQTIAVTVASKNALLVTLQVAGATETVTAAAETSVLETTRSHMSTTIDQRLVNRLPLNGRSFLELALLVPTVTRDAQIGDFSFAGQRAMNLVVVDGADNNNAFFGLPRSAIAGAGGLFSAQRNSYQFSQEAVQELQVNTNAYSAEFGRAGAGVVNVVTKSGTNDFHGSWFWYYRDRSMNANSSINKLNGEPKSPYHFHQFGGVLGGPILRDRLLFFVNYEGQRSTSENPVFLHLPANFALSADPSVAGYQQLALDYLEARAASYNRTFSQDVFLAKLDLQISPAHLLSGRWNRQRFTGENLETSGAQNSLEHTGTTVNNSDALTLSLTSSVGGSVFNVARFSYVQSFEQGRPNSINPEVSIFEEGQLALIAGRWVRNPRYNLIRQVEWADTVADTRGRHSLKMGVDMLLDWMDFISNVAFSGSYRFNSLESFGRNLAGSPSPAAGELYQQSFSGAGTRGATVHPDVQEFAAFIQDEFRIRPGLTLNLGLRYDFEWVAQGKVRNPSPALAAVGLDTSVIPVDKNNLAPRLGIAWAPSAGDRLVLRAGYGMFYARTPSLWTARAQFANGITVQTRELRAGTPSAASIPVYPNTLCGPPDPSGAPPSCAPPAVGAGDPTIVTFDPGYVQPLVHQGSVGVEYQPWNDFSVSLNGLWTRGTHLQRTRDINLATPTVPTNVGVAGTTTLLTYQKFVLPRPTAGFDRIWLLESAASSTYRAFVLQANKRFSHNFQLLASYTLSKVTDDVPDYFAVNPGLDDFRMVSDPSDPRADRSLGINDQRHRFVLAAVWQIDFAKRLPAPIKVALRDWGLSGIFSAQSGQPYSGRVNFDLNNDGNNATDRTPGLARNTFDPGSTAILDLRVTRSVDLNERVKLQLRWEAFNLFNSPNIIRQRDVQYSRSSDATACGIAGTPCLVPQNQGLSAFGTPTVTSGPRMMQLSARLMF